MRKERIPVFRFALSVLAIHSSAWAQLPDDFHRGVNYAHIHRGGRGYGSEVSRQALEGLRDIGVGCVAMTPFGYQQAHDDAHIRGIDGGDPSDAQLIAEAKAVHELGMKVMLKPHIWSRDFRRGGQWHGTIDQPDAAAHAQWWSDYRQLALHFARLAADAKIEIYCIGTELVMVTRKDPDEWRRLIGDIRKVYDGKLTYAAHWNEEMDRVAFWGDLDYVGVSAYFPLEAPPGADVAALRAAWSPHIRRLRQLHQRAGKPVLFLEVGYRGVDDCHRKPWEYSGGNPDAQAQARAYESLFDALSRQPWFRGTYYWKAFTDPNRGRRRGDASSYAVRGRPAEQVLRRWYAR